MKLLLTIFTLLASSRSAASAESNLVGHWVGSYSYVGTDNPIDITIDDRFRVRGSYTNPYTFGKKTIEGEVDREKGVLNLRFKRDQYSIRSIMGQPALSELGDKLTLNDAVLTLPPPDPTRKSWPWPVTCQLKRQRS